MNSRFKFRVWDDTHKQYLLASDAIIDGRTGKIFHDPIFAIEYSIEQCTGLKDKNGKLIFEGDVLQCINTQLIVCFKPAIASFVFIRDYDIEFSGTLEKAIEMRGGMSTDAAKYICSRYEIIGNIHDMEKDK